MTMIAGMLGVVVVMYVLSRLGRAWQRQSDRLRDIERDMYYESADRDGCEYPPQWRGR
ncbi:MAG: hypothetical protein ACJ780_10340 [Solirubrobacteraceae bacterium]|jgi:hypothetical protein